jgi:hypothetical protein
VSWTALDDDERDWLDEYVHVPDVLVVGCDLPSCVARWQFLSWVAMELGVSGENVNLETCRLLDRLSAGIDGDRHVGSSVIAAAVEAVPDVELLTVALELGLGHSPLDCPIEGLAVEVRAVIVKKLTFAVQQLARRLSRQLGSDETERSTRALLVSPASS